MRLGVSSLYLIGKSFDFVVKAIQTHELNLWEIVDDDTLTLNRERASELVELKKSFRIDYTVHAPFADINIAAANEDFRRMAIERLTRSLKCAHMIEAQLWVFHPGVHSGLNHFYPQKDLNACIKSVKELSKIAEDLNVQIVIENMPASIELLLRDTDDFRAFYRLAGDAAPNMVLDVGHANTTNQIEDFLQKQGDRIVHLHVHDNNGKLDSHERIGNGTVPWTKVTSSLNELGFNGTVIVESVREVAESVRAARQFFL